jgi:hypothetical protein
LFIDIWNPATSMFQRILDVQVREGTSEFAEFGVGAPAPIKFMEPGTTGGQLSDMIEFLTAITGTFTSDTETTPGERAGPEGPFTVVSISINLANDTGTTNFGQKFSLTEAGEANGETSATVNVPGVHLEIPGDDVDIKPFTFVFTSFNTEPAGGMEETFKGSVFKIVFESDADRAVPEPATLGTTGGGLLLLGIVFRRRWKSSLPQGL